MLADGHLGSENRTHANTCVPRQHNSTGRVFHSRRVCNSKVADLFIRISDEDLIEAVRVGE